MEIKEFYRDKKILVTGHTGFKGSWLTQILVDFGAKVCGVALRPDINPNLFSLLDLEKRIENHYTDIRDYELIKKIFNEFNPEIVLHLAAQPLVIDSYKDPRYTYDVNVMGTVNICECIRLSNSVKSFLNVTTDKVYENIEDQNHFYKEEDKLNGYDPYSNSKSCSELVTQSYMKSFFNDSGLAVSTCRAGNVIGGGDFSENRIIPDCVKAALNSEIIKVRNPNSYRPYQHVLEADMFYLLLAMEQYKDPKYAGHYNIGPDMLDCVSTGDIVSLFCNEWGNINYESVNINGPHEANFLKLDSTKARDTFDWNPKWSINDAIKKVVEWSKVYKDNKDIIDITRRQIEEYLCEK